MTGKDPYTAGGPTPPAAIETNTAEAEQPSVLSLIRRIQNGSLVAKTLSTPDRRSCVEHLTGEGYSAVEIAEVLKTSERTIFRDRRAIQEANAVRKDPKLVEQMVGRLMQDAELAISRIRRVVRDKQTPAVVKVDGERACWRITSELIQGLQSLGYLPTAAQQLQADLTHHLGAPQDAAALQAEIDRIQTLYIECRPDDVGGQQQIGQLGRLVSELTHEPKSTKDTNDA